MALNTKKIPNISSGIYFEETDLTFVSNNTGGFSSAALGLTEKGPAYEIITSATMEERVARLGNLNPNFPTSFVARQYLEQARNYKEVRLLGLEGYSDSRGFAIALQLSGNTEKTANAPLNLVKDSLMAVLKERRTSLTGRPSISKVSVQPHQYIDPNTGFSVTAATDYLFKLVIEYVDASTPEEIICSLRPESKDYIVKKFWNAPFKRGTKGEQIVPLIKGQNASLWVDLVIPSEKTKPANNRPYDYYLPGNLTPQGSLPLLVGDMTFTTEFLAQTLVVSDIEPIIGAVGSPSAGLVVGTKVIVNGNATSIFSSTPGVINSVRLSLVVGTGNMSQINGTWAIGDIDFDAGTSTTSFELYSLEDSIASGVPTTKINFLLSSSTFTSGTCRKFIVPTWEREVLDFANVVYQTPITPWFVSDGDENGDFRRLFRLWSISDGAAANTEIKVEIRNINPAGNNGKGTFDLIVRDFNDREDLGVRILEPFTNLTMDPSSDNYILRRIGDGEEEALRSSYILVEVNKELTEEDMPLLPYGILGYQNITNEIIPDLKWTTSFDLTKPITKQGLGLANNTINMNGKLHQGYLSFKNNTTGVIGKGFHLNPNNNTSFRTEQIEVFEFANQSIFTDAQGRAVVPQEKVRRSRFVVGFAGGFDGWNVYQERTWNDPLSKDFEALQLGLAVLSDKESIDADFTVLTTPDLYLDLHSTAVEEVLDMVVKRGDCIYIPDLSYDEESDPAVAADLVDASNIKSNSTAVYHPWLQVEDPVNKKNVWVAPSLLALGTIAFTAQNEQVWQPPGGAIRTAANNLLRTRRRMKLEDREILKRANINPITLFPGSGYEITEVRTTQEAFSALSFIHNRLLLCYAKKVLNQTLRPLLMQMNNDLTEDAFITTVRPIFDRIKKLNGLEEYTVEVIRRDENINRTTLYGRIIITPLYPVEQIIVEFVLQDGQISYNA